MDKISIRLSEEEKGALQEQAQAAGVSVSELIRDRLFPRTLAGTPATFAQVAELEKRVAVLLEAVGRLGEERENDLFSGEHHGAVSGPLLAPEHDLRLEKMERELAALAESFAELKQLFLEQKPAPSGWGALFSRRG